MSFEDKKQKVMDLCNSKDACNLGINTIHKTKNIDELRAYLKTQEAWIRLKGLRNEIKSILT